MDVINCACGQKYRPKDANAIKRHETTRRHLAGVGTTTPAPSFTDDERQAIINSLKGAKATYDTAIASKVVAESYVAAVVDKTPDIGDAILEDLFAFAQETVERLREEAEDAWSFAEEEEEEEAPPAPVVTKKAKPKVVKIRKTVNVGEHKVCRVCGKDKPLTEYRNKASRPDGKDTLCASCARDWLVTNRAKKAAMKAAMA